MSNFVKETPMKFNTKNTPTIPVPYTNDNTGTTFKKFNELRENWIHSVHFDI